MGHESHVPRPRPRLQPGKHGPGPPIQPRRPRIPHLTGPSRRRVRSRRMSSRRSASASHGARPSRCRTARLIFVVDDMSPPISGPRTSKDGNGVCYGVMTGAELYAKLDAPSMFNWVLPSNPWTLGHLGTGRRHPRAMPCEKRWPAQHPGPGPGPPLLLGEGSRQARKHGGWTLLRPPLRLDMSL